MSLSARRAWIEIPDEMRGDALAHLVALRKESVDRNKISPLCETVPGGSLSARRAWIEIVMQEIAQQRKQRSLSARRAWIEIHVVLVVPRGCWLSLSARRAWIEISSAYPKKIGRLVALRKESVDRNIWR